jgi:K+ transporter
MDMFLTTCFMSLILLTVWRKNVLLAPLFFVIFGLIEWCFLSSSLLKVTSSLLSQLIETASMHITHNRPGPACQSLGCV